MIHINRNGESLGQFAPQEVSNGLVSGRFFPTDLGWRDGMDAWQPLGTFNDLPPENTEFAPALSLAGMPGAERSAGSEEPGKIRFDECLSKAWECFAKNWVMCVLGTVIFFAITLVVQVPMQFAQVFFEKYGKGAASGDLLVVGGLAVGFIFFYAVASGVSSILSAGFMFFFIEALRSGTASLEKMFAGFRQGRWIQLLLAMLVWMVGLSLIIGVILIPGVILTASMKSQTPLLISGVLLILPVIYLSVSIGFVFPLIVDKNLGFWVAIKTALKTVHRQWWQAFGLILLVGLVALVGLLACCVGVLATGPLAYLIWGQGYRQLFGDGKLDER